MNADRVYVFNQGLGRRHGTEVYHLEERTYGICSVENTLCGKSIGQTTRRWGAALDGGLTWLTTESKAREHKLRLCKSCEAALT